MLDYTAARGIAGGLDADTYNWKDMSGACVGHTGSPGPNVQTTLSWLKRARDHNSTAILTINGVAYVGSGGSLGRTATVGAITEFQQITPAYVPAAGDWPGSLIWAAAIPTVASCKFLDLNVDGRAWAWDGS